jgi:beta-xylosidase
MLLAAIIGVLGANFTNPPLFEDLADLMIVRVNDTYYYSASTMHYSPGAPILRSFDLVNWEYIGHSVPTLSFGDNDAYNLVNGKRAYVRGVWASFFNYNSHTDTWFWGGCVDFNRTFIYTAPAVTGPWTQRSILNTCYYDSSLLVDDDGAMYVSYNSYNITVAKLSSDGLSQVSTQVVWRDTGTYLIVHPDLSQTIPFSRIYRRISLLQERR